MINIAINQEQIVLIQIGDASLHFQGGVESLVEDQGDFSTFA